LPIPIDSSDANNLCTMHIEAYTADLLLSHLVGYVQPYDAQDGSAA
jgi:hypothetical protein